MSILGALRTTAGTLEALARATEVVQQNIANASTPGYVRQRLSLHANPFEPGLTPGGLSVGALTDTRDQYLESSVRRENSVFGQAQQQKASLQDLERMFDVSGKSGLSAALSNLSASFSAWTVAPSNVGARTEVLNAAQAVAITFNSTAQGLEDRATQAGEQTAATVSEINRLIAHVRVLNQKQAAGGLGVHSLDAELHDTLEQLSRLLDVSPVRQPDGQMSIFLGGRHTLLIGDDQTELGITFTHGEDATYPGSLPPVQVLAGDQDVTASIDSGKLGALIEFRNQTLPTVSGGSETVGRLNQLATTFAARVNAISAAAGGPAIFSFESVEPTKAAVGLTVNPATRPEDLVAGSGTANDVALRLAKLANSSDPADQISGQSLFAFWSSVAADVGTRSRKASAEFDVQSAVLTQVRAIRAHESGVSLDEEALHLVELQRAYEATSRMARVLNEMSQTIIELVR